MPKPGDQVLVDVASSPHDECLMQEKWLGLTPYNEALRHMEECQAEEILGLEHPAVVTLGRRGDAEKDLTAQFNKQQFQLFRVERGGQATLHSPGQLVIYPLLTLKKYDLTVRQYVELLEAATASFLLDYGIKVEKHCNEPGLYTEKGKIAFFGVRIRNGRSEHGLALNVNNDLNLFNAIHSCGRCEENFDSLAEYGVEEDSSQLFTRWCKNFKSGLKLTSSLVNPSLTTEMRA